MHPAPLPTVPTNLRHLSPPRGVGPPRSTLLPMQQPPLLPMQQPPLLPLQQPPAPSRFVDFYSPLAYLGSCSNLQFAPHLHTPSFCYRKHTPLAGFLLLGRPSPAPAAGGALPGFALALALALVSAYWFRGVLGPRSCAYLQPAPHLHVPVRSYSQHLCRSRFSGSVAGLFLFSPLPTWTRTASLTCVMFIMAFLLSPTRLAPATASRDASGPLALMSSQAIFMNSRVYRLRRQRERPAPRTSSTSTQPAPTAVPPWPLAGPGARSLALPRAPCSTVALARSASRARVAILGLA